MHVSIHHFNVNLDGKVLKMYVQGENKLPTWELIPVISEDSHQLYAGADAAPPRVQWHCVLHCKGICDTYIHQESCGCFSREMGVVLFLNSCCE